MQAILNDIQACCVKFSGVAEDGMVECYVAIKVPKQALAAGVAKEVANVLTPEEKEEINFDEFKSWCRMPIPILPDWLSISFFRLCQARLFHILLIINSKDM